MPSCWPPRVEPVNPVLANAVPSVSADSTWPATEDSTVCVRCPAVWPPTEETNPEIRSTIEENIWWTPGPIGLAVPDVPEPDGPTPRSGSPLCPVEVLDWPADRWLTHCGTRSESSRYRSVIDVPLPRPVVQTAGVVCPLADVAADPVEKAEPDDRVDPVDPDDPDTDLGGEANGCITPPPEPPCPPDEPDPPPDEPAPPKPSRFSNQLHGPESRLGFWNPTDAAPLDMPVDP